MNCEKRERETSTEKQLIQSAINQWARIVAQERLGTLVVIMANLSHVSELRERLFILQICWKVAIECIEERILAGGNVPN